MLSQCEMTKEDSLNLWVQSRGLTHTPLDTAKFILEIVFRSWMTQPTVDLVYIHIFNKICVK